MPPRNITRELADAVVAAVPATISAAASSWSVEVGEVLALCFIASVASCWALGGFNFLRRPAAHRFDLPLQCMAVGVLAADYAFDIHIIKGTADDEHIALTARYYKTVCLAPTVNAVAVLAFLPLLHTALRLEGRRFFARTDDTPSASADRIVFYLTGISLLVYVVVACPRYLPLLLLDHPPTAADAKALRGTLTVIAWCRLIGGTIYAVSAYYNFVAASRERVVVVAEGASESVSEGTTQTGGGGAMRTRVQTRVQTRVTTRDAAAKQRRCLTETDGDALRLASPPRRALAARAA